jgi:hypothetical protein
VVVLELNKTKINNLKNKRHLFSSRLILLVWSFLKQNKKKTFTNETNNGYTVAAKKGASTHKEK